MKSPQHRKYRRPLQDLERNPFTRNTSRNHRPGLEAAFMDGHFSVNKKKKIADESDTKDDNASVNKHSSEQIGDRESSIVTCWELDMSIGARAAIYEQTRYIAKYGLDGEGAGNLNNKSSTRDEWDRIMDGSMSHASFSSTFITDHDASSSSFIHHPMQSGNNQSTSFVRGCVSVLDENQQLDMDGDILNSTIDQSDYFNSSRVAYLHTPEKNKAKVDEASRQARLEMLGGVSVVTSSIASKNTRARIPFPSIGKRADEKFHKSYSASVDGSTESNEMGMIGLFNAALRLDEEADDDSRNNKDDHNHCDTQEPESQSFVSYHEPNLSIVHEGFGRLLKDDTENFEKSEVGCDYIDDIVDTDAQESFISYREPDLSLMSSSRDHSNRAHSDFDVDVSEIIAPSEIGSKIEICGSETPNMKSSFTGDDDIPTTPVREDHCARSNNYDFYETSRRPLFSACLTPLRTSTQIMHTSDTIQSKNPQQNLSLEENDALLTWCPGDTSQQNIDSADEFRTKNPEVGEAESSPPRHGDALKFQADISLLSPIDTDYQHLSRLKNSAKGPLSKGNQKISFDQGTQNLQLGITSPQGLSSLSSNSLPPSIGKDIMVVTRDNIEDTRFLSISKKILTENASSIPRKISLRERYSRLDRFEDNYSLPSSASPLI